MVWRITISKTLLAAIRRVSVEVAMRIGLALLVGVRKPPRMERKRQLARACARRGAVNATRETPRRMAKIDMHRIFQTAAKEAKAVP